MALGCVLVNVKYSCFYYSIVLVTDQLQLVKIKIKHPVLVLFFFCFFYLDLQTFGITLDETQLVACK